MSFALEENEMTDELDVILNDNIIYEYGVTTSCYPQPEIIDHCFDE
jgi:hypothetical protein